MAAAAGWFKTRTFGDRFIIEAGGRWNVQTVEAIEGKLRGIGAEARASAASGPALIDVAGLDALDAAGAWLITRTRLGLAAVGMDAAVEGAKPSHGALLERVEKALAHEELPPQVDHIFLRFVSAVGKAQFDVFVLARSLLSFFGLVLIVFGRVMLRPGQLRLTATVYRMQSVGLNALPIVGLLSFLIGVVVAFQGADQLAQFGAEIFTVNLLGVSILRELGVLLTAILIAGRSGSAFTAQIGTMKVNQEIDALETIGLDPIEVLVIPRIIALMIMLPVLVFYADLMGLLGGMVMATTVLDISLNTFLKQLQSGVNLTTFAVGMVKAPVFAFLIALVGCFEGFNVSGSAESVGQKTTASVVEGIFLVIVFDAAFSILFSILGI
ncbi:MAG TPA: ABC transporter permease [Alphaproteobacteria bacterium]|nr:ABC transporter permease [Alphaproteobacteria bacterium]